MLKVYIAALFLLWLAGMITSHTFGGLIHLLPILAVVLVYMRYSDEYPTRAGDTGPRMKASKQVRPIRR